MPKYLDEIGLAHFWDNVKDNIDYSVIDNSEILPYEMIGTPVFQIKTADGQSIQGGIYIDNCYVVALYDSTETTLKKYDSNGNELASSTNAQFGHANAMTTDADGNIVLIGDNYNLLKINPSNFEVISSVQPAVNVFSIARDIKDNTYFGMSDTNLYHFDSEFNLISTYSHHLSFTFQGIAVDGDYIYSPVNQTGQIITLTKYGKYHATIRYNIGPTRTEPEFIYFQNNNMYLGIQAQDGFGVVVEFAYNSANPLLAITYNNATNSHESTYYIDSDAATGICDGSSSHPLGSLDMALSMRLGSVVNIYIKGTFTKHAYYISNIANLTITRFDENTTYTIGFLNLTNCVRFSVSYGTISTMALESCTAYLAVNTIATLNVYRSIVDVASYNTLSTVNLNNSKFAMIPNQNLSNPTVTRTKSTCSLSSPVTISTDTDSSGKTYTCDYLQFFDKYLVGIKTTSGVQTQVLCTKLWGTRYVGSALARPGSANWKLIFVDFTVNGNQMVVNNAVYQELSNLQHEVVLGIQTLDGIA